MIVTLASDFPVTDAASRKATGKSLKEWFAEIDKQKELQTKRREAIQWMYDTIATKDIWWPTTIWVEYERTKGAVNKKDGRIEGFNICVTKTLSASLADVWNAWTDPTMLNRWFGDSVTAKVTDKGSFDDGDGHTGEYLRVRSNKDLRFSWKESSSDAPTLVDVVFSDKGKGKTGIVLQHQRIQNRSEADGLRCAWGDAFDALKALLEG